MNLLNLHRTRKIPDLVPPLVLVGVLVVLLPVFALMTMDRVKKQDEFIRERFVVTGTSLIRTFEAGTRTGFGTMRWSTPKVQAMLEETASLPDVSYIMITDAMGKIIAHSSTEKVGQIYQGWSDLGTLPRDPRRVISRSLNTSEGPVLEVVKRFVPFRAGFRKHRHRTGKMGMPDEPLLMPPMPPRDLTAKDPGIFQEQTYYIFAGLSMTDVQTDQARVLRKIVIRSVIFFVLGCSGIIALFAFQAYRSAQASLERVKAFSDNVVQNMPSGLMTLDTDFFVTSANRAAEKMLGAIPDSAYPGMAALCAGISDPGETASKEIVVPGSNGANLRLDVTASAISGDEEAIQGFILLFRDLTQLQDLKKQVETNQRLAAIGKLAAGVAHEIRNPLSSIKGFATYFAKRYEHEPEDVEIAKIMINEVGRMNRSVTQLLEFAKPMSVEIKPVEIAPLIRHSLKLVAHDLEEKQIQVETDIQINEAFFPTDPERITQVLLNLYMNALNAMADKGTLSIGVTKADSRLEFRVGDNGCGIPAIDLEHIFDPYFTTRAKGTGLGLSIVHRIVEKLNGEIRVESADGKGSVFYISLPGDAAQPVLESKNIKDS